jgi:hypothetical protein
VRRWKKAPETITPVVSSNSRTPDPHGDSTMPQTWSLHVIARNWASMIHSPYSFRNRGTGRLTPTSFCTTSEMAPKGHTAHQSRPTSTKVIGSTGHHSTHIRAVPAFFEGAAGPARS